jgi:phosphoribosylformylglycinamidine (FGAM) synthase-like amidotransferase family enzyme
MAAAFTKAGFEATDVHMSQILSEKFLYQDLRDWLLVEDSPMVMFLALGEDGQTLFY